MKNRKVNVVLILIAIILLIANTYSWFINNENVNMGMGGRIEKWDIEFSTGQTIQQESVQFEMRSIYPGMEEYKKDIEIVNNGNIPAEVSYKIKSITVMGEKYELNEGYTQDDLEAMLEDYPFEVTMEFTKSIITKEDNRSVFSITLSWPFGSESDTITEQDKKDTEWGQKAYEYEKNSTEEVTENFKIEIVLIAKQVNV